MPSNSFYASLPYDVQNELQQRIMDNGFSHYIEITDWLNQLGYKTSKSSVHRFGQILKESLGIKGAGVSMHLQIRDPLPIYPPQENSGKVLLAELGQLRLRETEILQQLSHILDKYNRERSK